MKTSKIILTIILGTVALFIISASLDIRFTGTKEGENPPEIQVDSFPVSPFSTLVLDDSKRMVLVRSDSFYIETFRRKDLANPGLNYAISGDSLKMMNNQSLLSVKIHATDTVWQLIMNNSRLTIQNFDYPRFRAYLAGSRLYIGQGRKQEDPVRRLEIVALNSRIGRTDSRRLFTDTLFVRLEHSHANLNIRSDWLRVALSDSSVLNTNQAENIDVKKDSLSRIGIR